MNARHLLAVSAMAVLVMPFALNAQGHTASVADHELHFFEAAEFGINPENVTFSRDIAPILQRSCENCHRAGGGAPMALTTYQEVRRWSQRIKLRTAIRDRMGAMPPFFVEKEIGISQFKDDQSLSDEELATIQAWVDNGAPRGDPGDMPPALEFPPGDAWTIGEPDLVLRSREVIVPAIGPDPRVGGGYLWAARHTDAGARNRSRPHRPGPGPGTPDPHRPGSHRPIPHTPICPRRNRGCSEKRLTT